MKNSIVILDFGSQYTQLIARRIRELGVYTEIYPYSIGLEGVKELAPSGVILSGGPSSVHDSDAPLLAPGFFDIGIPILGICYGMQLMSHLMGGKVEKATNREYGRAQLVVGEPVSQLFKDVEIRSVVWMSHGDSVVRLAPGFEQIATTSDNDLAAIQNSKRSIYAVQFHPEVAHSEQGKKILSNFIFGICGMTKNWSMRDFVDKQIEDIRKVCANKKVVLGVSGGVDSTTLAVLMNKAIGEQSEAVFVNNGLLRWNEADEVQKSLRERLNLNIRYIDASEQFLGALKGEKDPEKKRKAIGKVFIDVFWHAVKDFDYLVQGTLYPDVIESAPVKGPSRTIKTHHNRVAEVEKLEKEGRILEPFRFLFKDEVREVARILGMPEDILNRHPFPGPGLAVRVIDDVTPEKLDILRRADKIFIDALHKYGWYDKVWQAFAVFMPIRSVGVMGDERAYGNVIGLRAVTSVDGMTANWGHLPYELLDEAGNTIIRQIREVNRVVYDITSKPPATIEWE
ncbi:MAG: glutamine-hydrolyzing GMP synthase [Spirochaetes bacterium GWF1_51_8]|nr:MAG: glutamine-hydrolyzing GMP synthase [Spirochaetes bacterium GWF1_51_8]